MTNLLINYLKMRDKICFLLVLSLLALNSCELTDLLLDEDPRDAITGEWKVDEDSQIFGKKSAERFYNVSISKDATDSTAVHVSGFYELNGKVRMHLNFNNISIPDQAVDGFTIENGSGSIASDKKSITLYYYVDFGTGEKDIVRADYSR